VKVIASVVFKTRLGLVVKMVPLMWVGRSSADLRCTRVWVFSSRWRKIAVPSAARVMV
jgi:hypothetical protein